MSKDIKLKRFELTLFPLITALCFVFFSLSFGKVFRAPFDDELFTLEFIHTSSITEILRAVCLQGYDLHGPVSYLLFRGLLDLGGGEYVMRFVSLTLTGLSLSVWHFLLLKLVKNGSLAFNLSATFVFALTPLALGVGDALRYYPIFCLLSALLILIYVSSEKYWFYSAAPLGLLASTSFLALHPLVVLLIHRYVVRRRFSLVQDFSFFLLLTVFSLPGILFAFNRYFTLEGSLSQFLMSETVFDPIHLLPAALGFFGGYIVGISNSWLALIYAGTCAALAFAGLRMFWRTQEAAGVLSLCLLNIFLMAVFLVVFPKTAARSYLFVAPMVPFFACLGLRAYQRAGFRMYIVWLLLFLIVGVGLWHSATDRTRPFKRNTAIPYDRLEKFISENSSGRTVIFSTDPVILYLLKQKRSDLCLNYREAETCLATSTFFETLVLVEGHTHWNPNSARRAAVKTLRQGFVLSQRAHFGLDRDAPLKEYLTGKNLSVNILEVTILHRSVHEEKNSSQ